MKSSLSRFSSTLALLAPTAVMLAPNADAAIYMKFDGIEGEVMQKGHEKWIEILSWSWGVSNSGSMASGGGGGAGKVSLSSFNIMHRIDKASPMLFLACAQGKHIKSATLTFTRSVGEGPEQAFYKITLSDILVSSVNGTTPPNAALTGDDRPMESLSLNFSKIKMEYTPTKPDGSSDVPVSGEFSFIKY